MNTGTGHLVRLENPYKGFKKLREEGYIPIPKDLQNAAQKEWDEIFKEAEYILNTARKK